MEEPAAAPPGDTPAAAAAGRSGVVFVSPVVGVQTPANRFCRPGVEREIRAKILEDSQNPNLADDDFDDTDSEDESVAPQPADVVAGAGAADALDDGSDDADSVAESAPSAPAPAHELLQFGRQRMNLAVLSQHYNLYFVAYKGRIHVFEPQNAPQVVKDGGLLVLQPPPSRVAAMCPGHIDQGSGHEINNMIVGDLGDLEVVVAAYDDGDVVGYYTHTIAAMIENSARRHKGWMSTPRPPREFFHAAVGASAWGLALHKKSRLLAVSCNLLEITVFAFSLRGPGDSSGEPGAPPATTMFLDYDLSPMEDRSPLLASAGLTANALQRHLRHRTRDWRIILTQPGRNGANIPSIDFLDDEYGEADKVIAVDIAGSCWTHSIWGLGANIAQVPTLNQNHRCSWGVMVLPDAFFRAAQTGEEFLGASVGNIDGCRSGPAGLLLDISRSAKLVPENPTAGVELDRFHFGRPRPHGPPAPVNIGALFRHTPAGETAGQDDDDRGCQRYTEPDEALKRWERLGRVEKDDRRPKTATAALGVDGAGPHEPLTIVPSLGLVYRHETMAPVKFLHDILYNHTIRKHLYDRMMWDVKYKPPPPEIARRYAVLRMGEEDVELLCLDTSKASILCRRLLVPHNPDKVKEPWDMAYSNRMCMKHCIPELNLVVVGSTCGRVALLRLTKARRGWQQVRHGFRVEWVLPRTKEEDRKVRPHLWMVGMSVSQVPQPGARGVRLFPPGRGERRRHNQPFMADPIRRWRLMLHYMDHTVLTYTIEASDPDGPCSVTPQAAHN